MSSQNDHETINIPAQRCGEHTGHPHCSSDEWVVCVEAPDHETQGTDHQSVDGTRW